MTTYTLTAEEIKNPRYLVSPTPSLISKEPISRIRLPYYPETLLWITC